VIERPSIPKFPDSQITKLRIILLLLLGTVSTQAREIEDAVTRGLAFLASPAREFAKSGNGLVLLAFLAHGHRPDQGPYGAFVRQGIDALLRSQKPSGYMGDILFAHHLSMMALATCLREQAGPIPQMKDALEDAVVLLIALQEKDGSWGYAASGERSAQSSPYGGDRGYVRDNLAVTAGNLIALRLAQEAGVKVPTPVVTKAVKYLRRLAIPSGQLVYGFSAFDPRPPFSMVVSSTASGVLALLASGVSVKDKTVVKALAYLDRLPAPRKLYDKHDSMYAAFYETALRCTLGDASWPEWYRTFQAVILATQTPEGTFKVPGSWNQPVEMADTAFALLALGFPKGHLPLFPVTP